MSVNDQYGMNPIVLTIQQNGNDVKSLKLKDNANISSRFPGLSDFKSCPHIPIIHNMVKILLRSCQNHIVSTTGLVPVML